MAPYLYSHLSVKPQEIRLLTLLPGAMEDPIWFSINHTPFQVTRKSHTRKTFSHDHISSLPPRWELHETLEGRVIYDMDPGDGSPEIMSWTHPDPSFQSLEDETHEHSDEIGFEPGYEALSYVWGSQESPALAYVHEPPELSIDTGVSRNASRTLEIGQNLALALKHLRYMSRPRTLWIDAICKLLIPNFGAALVVFFESHRPDGID